MAMRTADIYSIKPGLGKRWRYVVGDGFDIWYFTARAEAALKFARLDAASRSFKDRRLP